MTVTYTEVYTDGSCLKNPGGCGGWAWLVPDGPRDSGGELESTNNRMEIQAVLEAVRALDGPLLIYSDSRYVVDCLQKRWYEGWEKRGWKTSAKKPVKNQDLWKPLVELVRDRSVQMEWVRGHMGLRWNEEADIMARHAAHTEKRLSDG